MEAIRVPPAVADYNINKREYDRLLEIFNRAAPGRAPALPTPPTTGEGWRTAGQNLSNTYRTMLTQGQIPQGSEVYQIAPAPTDASGRPLAPAFNTILDPTTGLLRDQYNVKGNIDTRGMEALRTEALRTGPSAWRTLNENLEANKLAQMQGSQLSQAKNALAGTRGLSSGAGERLATQNALTGLMGRQNLSSQMAIADENKRMAALNALPGQELNLSQFNRGTEAANIAGATSEIGAKRQQENDQYMKQMEAWAAERVAAATPKGGKGGK